MHLQRIQVPDFRALKNVDITFEKEFTPRIFPFGSQNGGGKSTLLQLIFVLLHCAGNPDRLEFIQNLLHGFEVNDESGKRTLAIIDIWDGSKTVKLDFFVCNESFIPKDNEVTEDNELKLSRPIPPANILKKHNLLDITNLDITNLNTRSFNFGERLVCQTNDIDIVEIEPFLTDLSNKMFLTAHISQIFLFLQPDNRKSLFKTQANNQTNYYQQIKTANSKLPGFFTYDFLSIDILIEAFKKTRDDDFKQAVEKGGNYGNNYVKLLDELNNLLSNKKINVQPDLSGINFKIDGDDTELYPEDLSHGELKRLCIYMWLKYNKIEDAIVLMDELEISFHPDWQYQIVRDLEEWGATNQYILATHSYELCNAVTPAHVKELDPKLQARTIQ
ncbi:AAA family ATPase [Anabaena sp. UHCC 0253]|uniref:AAA family ATPase n=1 Tax=Anabaena sp. UHCC 0253 TaxID=2590019 RepID=UPI001446022F|nr:AAA family ATPase [Anabaena sp. UHCC 0253]MTJ54573.1 AAA family ATPase [Anabaena sp. UHCC 0253]